MKLGNKLQFGINAVISGQKVANVKAVPQLIVNSTIGKFSVTSVVSKAMNVAVGENIMFLNNISGVETAIQQKVDDIVAYANEHNIDIDSVEGEKQLLKEFTQWFIAKGVPQFDSKGRPVMASERYTKEDKLRYIAEHGMEIVEANRDAFVENYGNLTDEEFLAKITPEMVESPKYHSCSGSKTSTSGSTTGVGANLNFTDSAIWNTIKADLGDEASKKNRIYDVVLEDAVEVPYFNGKDNVNIIVYPINFVEDVDVAPRGKKETND